jgi:hypothetical protein
MAFRSCRPRLDHARACSRAGAGVSGGSGGRRETPVSIEQQKRVGDAWLELRTRGQANARQRQAEPGALDG